MADALESYTLEDLKNLEKSLADGVKSIQFQDRRIEYRSFDEMKQLIAMIRARLGVDKRRGPRGIFGGRRIVAKHSKGLDD